MITQPGPAQPSLPWRISSVATMGFVGSLSRILMYGVNRPEVHGLDNFQELLDKRREPENRTRGLITVSNHMSVLDDPFIWGALPFRYAFDPNNHRWTLGSYDICFKDKLRSAIFNLGQLLPTHRLKHSIHGGLFQPTMSEAIRLLSDCPSFTRSNAQTQRPHSAHFKSTAVPGLIDPFSSTSLTYSTNGEDTFPAPSAYESRRYSWIHVFPEGYVHQHPGHVMRYFKWGVARLVLEADECPDIIPMWIEGSEKVMPEDRGFPRFLPRLGQRIGIWFGENVAGDRNDSAFVELRQRWQMLVRKAVTAEPTNGRVQTMLAHPDTLSEHLKYGDEAVQLRIECATKIREAVLDVRRKRGLPDEDPKAGLAETWKLEGGTGGGKKDDGSIVREM